MHKGNIYVLLFQKVRLMTTRVATAIAMMMNESASEEDGSEDDGNSDNEEEEVEAENDDHCAIVDDEVNDDAEEEEEEESNVPLGLDTIVKLTPHAVTMRKTTGKSTVKVDSVPKGIQPLTSSSDVFYLFFYIHHASRE
jgi:hypothetical protein